MNRAAKCVLSADSAPSRYSHLAERATTLPMQKKDGMHSDVPHSVWREPELDVEEATVCYAQQDQDQDSEVSREEQILDMLKKVERQKRLLLKEFGASLPDNIFNASIKPFFEDRTPAQATAQVADTAKPPSPEITVINMSSYKECVKKDRKAKRKPEIPSTKKIEIAVQATLDKPGPAEDKSVQVELPRETVDAPHSGKDTIAQAPHPIEPRVTVITPETDDSSNDSTNSDVTGMVIEISNQEVTVTPKKRKSSLKVSKRPSPRVYQKIRSTSVSSKATSPVKRFSRSHSSSRLPSPQKRTRCTDMPDTASRRVDIHVSKSEYNDETDPSQETRVSIDASAESSQTYSGVNDQDVSTGKPYRVRTQMKKWIRIKDTSDTTSTSFASPPPVKPRSMLDALTNITPILEMLDSSGYEEMRRLRQEISPVSTPETPSPRTMRMPSNIPRLDKISRMLRYNSNHSRNNDDMILSSTQKDQSILTDPSDASPQEAATSEHRPTCSQQPPVSSQVCTCKNPKCKLLHMKLDEIHDYALKNCPEMLQKYEDLQNLCTERIASLTDLIERVRNEQKGKVTDERKIFHTFYNFIFFTERNYLQLCKIVIYSTPQFSRMYIFYGKCSVILHIYYIDMDLSLISPSDETSLMQLSTSRPARNDVQAIRKLIESIEAIHSQLAQTLFESQKIIENGATPDNELSNDAEAQKAVTSTPRSKSIDTAPVQKFEVANDKAKPKVISNEKVNIQLNRFKIQQKPQAMSAVRTPEHNSWPPCAFSLHEEEVIEKLSKEILEQSKSLDKASSAFVRLKGNDEISTQRKELPSKDTGVKTNTLLEHQKDNSTTSSIQEVIFFAYGDYSHYCNFTSVYASDT